MSKIDPLFMISVSIFLALFAGCAQNAAMPVPSPQPTESWCPLPTSESAASLTPLPTPEPTPTQPDMGYEPTQCRTSTRARLEIECGDLTVLEDRSRPDGNLIKLYVAIVHSPDPNPEPDPLVVLEGGPGWPASISMDYWLTVFQNVLKQRDVILLDQRGTGKSQPSLDCPEVPDQIYAYLAENLSAADEMKLDTQALQVCHDRLVQAGVDLAAYTSATNAVDVEDLRKALGYAQWNLYGGSYGTRLALNVMRDYPEGVRSAILDSVCLPQADHYAEIAASGERAFNLLFESCAADPACNQAYPDLVDVFYGLVEQLDTEPVNLTVTPYMSGTSIPMKLNGDRLINAMFSMLYNSDLIPRLPKMIYEFKEGNWTGLQQEISQNLGMYAYLSEGMGTSVNCSDEATFSSEEAVQSAHPEVNPRLRAALYFSPIFETCAFWGAAVSPPIEAQEVSSDVPTLILAGEYDPIHPPSWGQQAAETLPQAQYLEFPGYGHGALAPTNLCALKILDQFLANPAAPVDASCVEKIKPTFRTK